MNPKPHKFEAHLTTKEAVIAHYPAGKVLGIESLTPDGKVLGYDYMTAQKFFSVSYSLALDHLEIIKELLVGESEKFPIYRCKLEIEYSDEVQNSREFAPPVFGNPL